MSLDHILLGMLREPATGYDLGREFAESASHFWFAERSQIYPTLKRLEKRGLLRVWTEPSERGPERKVYETTDEGRQELRRWLRDGPHIGRDRLAYIAQTFFLGELEDLRECQGVVRAMRAKWRETLATFEFFEQGLLAETGGSADIPDRPFFHYAALRMGLYQLRAKLAWCEETLERLRQRLGDEAGVPEPDPVRLGDGASED